MQFFQQRPNLRELAKRHRRFLMIILVLALIVVAFLVFWFASKILLNTEYPMLPVSTGNMCLSQTNCDGWTHPFEPTLHIGDLVIIQGAGAENARFEYPNSDILVFQIPKSGFSETSRLIITRIVTKEEINGTVYFRTKSDGEGTHVWPEMPETSECDNWYDYRENYTWNGMISERLQVGKVVFRVPWIGHLILFVQSSFGMIMIVVLVILVVIVNYTVQKSAGKKVKICNKEIEKTVSKRNAL